MTIILYKSLSISIIITADTENVNAEGELISHEDI